MKKWQTWVVLIAVFVSGLVMGSVGAGFYMKHRIGGILHQGLPGVKKEIMKKLTSELNLTPDQQDEVEEIVEETQLQLQQLRAEYHPKMEKIIENGIAVMKTRLTAEQQSKLDALYDRVKKRWSIRRRMREGK